MRGFATALALLGSTLPTAAAEIEGVTFAERTEMEGRTLALQGVGLLRYRWVFKGYVAALYLPPDVPGADALDDVPKRLEIEYFWSIDGPRFGDAADELLAHRLSERELAPLRERLARLHAEYEAVEPGDRYALDYAPETGTTLRKNDEALVTIAGADFAAAYFGIWLGEEPLDDALREQLLEAR